LEELQQYPDHFVKKFIIDQKFLLFDVFINKHLLPRKKEEIKFVYSWLRNLYVFFISLAEKTSSFFKAQIRKIVNGGK